MFSPFRSIKNSITKEFVMKFLFSKRNVGVVVSAVVLYLNHRGVIVPDKVQADMVDQAAVLAGMLWTVVTKFMDTYQAEKKEIEKANQK